MSSTPAPLKIRRVKERCSSVILVTLPWFKITRSVAKTATAGSDVVKSGSPIFDDFSNICGRISTITRRMLSSKWSSVCGLSA
ncbi:hypothetical protein TNCV_1185881 [Trichonephila clavipes]|nr:hypothetical protein TNCV_1185881 [Trichonephila clavipes]